MQSVLVYILAFQLELGIAGVFMAKALMETYLLMTSFAILKMQNWTEIVATTKGRLRFASRSSSAASLSTNDGDEETSAYVK